MTCSLYGRRPFKVTDFILWRNWITSWMTASERSTKMAYARKSWSCHSNGLWWMNAMEIAHRADGVMVVSNLFGWEIKACCRNFSDDPRIRIRIGIWDVWQHGKFIWGGYHLLRRDLSRYSDSKFKGNDFPQKFLSHWRFFYESLAISQVQITIISDTSFFWDQE